MRRLYLGSVNSLSFEEEENDYQYYNGRFDYAMEATDNMMCNNDNVDNMDVGLELHDMLTERLEEQVRTRRYRRLFKTWSELRFT